VEFCAIAADEARCSTLLQRSDSMDVSSSNNLITRSTELARKDRGPQLLVVRARLFYIISYYDISYEPTSTEALVFMYRPV
jgi:hypothetical protein